MPVAAIRRGPVSIPRTTTPINPIIPKPAVEQKTDSLARRLFTQITPYLTKRNALYAAGAIVVSSALYFTYKSFTASNENRDGLDGRNRRVENDDDNNDDGNDTHSIHSSHDGNNDVDDDAESTHSIDDGNNHYVGPDKEKLPEVIPEERKEINIQTPVSKLGGVDVKSTILLDLEKSLQKLLEEGQRLLRKHLLDPDGGYLPVVKTYTSKQELIKAFEKITDPYMEIYSAAQGKIAKCNLGWNLSEDDKIQLNPFLKKIQDLNEAIRIQIVNAGNEDLIEITNVNVSFVVKPEPRMITDAVKWGNVRTVFETNSTILLSSRLMNKKEESDRVGVFGDFLKSIPEDLKRNPLFTEERFNQNDPELKTALKKLSKDCGSAAQEVAKVLSQIMHFRFELNCFSGFEENLLTTKCDFLSFDKNHKLLIVSDNIENRIKAGLNLLTRNRNDKKDFSTTLTSLRNLFRVSKTPEFVMGRTIKDSKFVNRKLAIVSDYPGSIVNQMLFEVECEVEHMAQMKQQLDRTDGNSQNPINSGKIEKIKFYNWNEVRVRVGIQVDQSGIEKLKYVCSDIGVPFLRKAPYQYIYEGFSIWKASIKAIFIAPDLTIQEQKSAVLKMIEEDQKTIIQNKGNLKLSLLALAKQLFSNSKIALETKCAAQDMDLVSTQNTINTLMYQMLVNEIDVPSVSVDLLQAMDETASRTWEAHLNKP